MPTIVESVSDDPAAHDLLGQAHNAAYRFPEGFGGFEADLEFNCDGFVATGTVCVTSPRSINLDLDVPEDDQKWLRQELGSIAGHRWNLPYERADGGNTLTLSAEDGDPSGRVIQVHGDRFDSSYRVQQGEISQVNRAMGQMGFSIQIQNRVAASDGRTLPSDFTVLYWNTDDGRFSRADVYKDTYEDVEGVYLPVSRRIISADDEGVTVRQLRLSRHALLESGEMKESGQLEYRDREQSSTQ